MSEFCSFMLSASFPLGNSNWIKIRYPYLETNSFKFSHDVNRDKNFELTLNYFVFIRWIL